MEVVIKDGDLDKTFLIDKMKATQLDGFISLIAKIFLKDTIKYPDGIFGKDIIHTLHGLVQNGTDAGGNTLDKKLLLENALPILRSVYSQLEETERIIILDKLISTSTYKNGVVTFPLTYFTLDNHIEKVSTIYSLAWEIVKVNFPSLSRVD